MTTNLEAAAYFYSQYEGKLAKELLRSYQIDEKLRRRDLEQDRKAIEEYTKIANEKNEKLAQQFLRFYLRFLSPATVRAEAAKLQRKYEKQISDTTKQRDELVGAYNKLGKMSSAEEKLLESAKTGLRERPNFWLEKMYGVGIAGQKGVTSFAGSDSPAVYKAMELATGSENFFADHFDDLGLDVNDLYVAYHTDPDQFNKLIDDAIAASGELKEDLKSAQTTPQVMQNIIETGFGDAYKAYVKNDIIKAATDADITKLNGLIENLKRGGTPADISMAVATADGWNKTIEAAAKIFDGDREKAENYLRQGLLGVGAVDPDDAVKAIALQSQNPEGIAEAFADPEKMKDYIDSSMLSSLQSRADPGASMIAQLFKDLETFNEDSAFATWRKANGIVSTAPPGLAEFQRYNRQVNRVGSPLFRAKRTGDIREVTVVDERYAIPTRTGVMSFAAETGDGSKKYLTGQELEAMSAEQLTSEDTRYVEVDLTEDEVRERIFASIVNPENNPDMREELQKFGKTEGFKSRARMVYDKKEGKFVILDDNLAVVYSGGVENPSALLIDVNDSRFAEPAGSAKGFQANKAQNRLEDDEFAAMLALKQGEQATQLAGYQPAQRAKVATKTFTGEATYVPGQDATKFSYLTVGPGGRRQTRTIGIQDLISDNVVTNDDEGFRRHRERIGAEGDATPQERRQFNRLFRPPLFDKRERGSRRARVQAGDMTSEVETYEAKDFRPPETVAETPETSETPKDGDTAKQKTGGKSELTALKKYWLGKRDPFAADLTGGDPDAGPTDDEMMARFGRKKTPPPVSFATAFDVKTPIDLGSFEGVEGDPSFTATDRPGVEEFAGSPTYGTAITGTLLRLLGGPGQSPAEQQVRKSRRKPEGRLLTLGEEGYYKQEVDQFNLQRALRAYGVDPESLPKGPNEEMLRLLEEQGVDVASSRTNDEDENTQNSDKREVASTARPNM